MSLTPFVDERESVTFIAITIYISLTTIFFAAVVADAPSERMAVIRSGYMFAAILAATLGIFGYFDIAGLGPYFTLYDNSRAMGPFKDPNVFGPFLVPPIVWLCQDVLLRRGHFVAATAKLVVLLIGLFLSFSRGAMVDGVASLVMLLGLTFSTAPSTRLRGRTVVVALLGALLVACLLAIVLAIPERQGHGPVARVAGPGLRRRRGRALRQSDSFDTDASRPAFRIRPAALQPHLSARPA